MVHQAYTMFQLALHLVYSIGNYSSIYIQLQSGDGEGVARIVINITQMMVMVEWAGLQSAGQ